MKLLNLSEAHRLYSLLKSAFPENSKDVLIPEFLMGLLSNIKDQDMLDIFCLLLEEEPDTILKRDRGELLVLLVRGFELNRLLSLMEFFDGITNV